jgi:hypothetical protein
MSKRSRGVGHLRAHQREAQPDGPVRTHRVLGGTALQKFRASSTRAPRGLVASSPRPRADPESDHPAHEGQGAEREWLSVVVALALWPGNAHIFHMSGWVCAQGRPPPTDPTLLATRGGKLNMERWPGFLAAPCLLLGFVLTSPTIADGATPSVTIQEIAAAGTGPCEWDFGADMDFDMLSVTATLEGLTPSTSYSLTLRTAATVSPELMALRIRPEFCR